MKNLRSSPIISFLSFALLLGLCSSLFAYVNARASVATPTDTPLPSRPIRTVILDAGHGGEDGGCESADGALEKDLNLAIVFLLRELLESNGIEVILTRDTDTLLYDRTVDYHGRKKALDFAARKKIAEEHPDAVFVSIHMNTYPRPDCKGLQVWYSPNHPDSCVVADAVQGTVKALLQPDNHRKTKSAGSNIYLLHVLQNPTILIECGFLSSPEEASLLEAPVYQQRLAFAIFSALMKTDLSS